MIRCVKAPVARAIRATRRSWSAGDLDQVWLGRLEPWRAIRVPGLPPDYPAVHCNQSEVCVVTTGMGHSNAAASVSAPV
jgi:purine nucleoside permease